MELSNDGFDTQLFDLSEVAEVDQSMLNLCDRVEQKLLGLCKRAEQHQLAWCFFCLVLSWLRRRVISLSLSPSLSLSECI